VANRNSIFSKGILDLMVLRTSALLGVPCTERIARRIEAGQRR